MNVATPDAIVVGLGAVGSAVCHYLAADGAKSSASTASGRRTTRARATA